MRLGPKTSVFQQPANVPVDHIDRLGLDVYRVTSSSLLGVPLHRKIVGDDGTNGCYILEFFVDQSCCTIGASGHAVLGKGKLTYQHANHSAAEEIKLQGYRVAERIETSNVYHYPGNLSVDAGLAAEAARMGPSEFGPYIFIFNDCGTLANSWLRRATQSLINARGSWPGLPPSW